MNVLYIVGGEGNKYGSEIIAINLIKAGVKNNINYTVICAHQGVVSEACSKLDVKYYVVPFTFFVYKEMSVRTLDKIKRNIWLIKAEYLTTKACRFVESHVDIKSIDVIHTNLTRDLLGGILSEKYQIPHLWHIQELFKAHYQLSFLKHNQMEWMACHADRFAAISATVAREWVENGLPEKKMSVIRNGIDLNSIQPKTKYDDKEILKLVIVGHLVPAKGQLAVIEKLSRLPANVKEHLYLDCIGEGSKEYVSSLRKLAREYQLHLKLHGYRNDVGQILKNYDIGLNCSRGEGFGLATVEYMAAGLCPVVSNTGANTEIIENSRNGYVFDYQSETDLSDLIQFLYYNRADMIAIAKKARADAVGSYSLEQMEKNVFHQYEDLARNN